MEKPSGSPRRISVRTKILLVFLGLSVSALIVAGLLASVQLKDVSTYALDRSTDLGNRAMEDSSAALEQSTKTSLLRLARDQASISNVIFERVSDEIDMTAAYAGRVMENPGMVRGRRFYLQDERPPDRFATTVLFLSPGIEQDSPSDERDAAGMMDDIFIPVYQNDPNLAALYVGTQSGMSMIYPWTTGLNQSFDPRLRGWFTNARKSGAVTWSEPYVDLLGHGLMVTCSRPVSDPGRNWYWVVGADVTIETINQDIIGTQVGDRGYAMLIDQHGNIITRPGLTAGDMRWDETFVTENLLESDNDEIVAAAQNMTAGKTGIERVTYDDGDRFIAYAPVESVNWSVAVVMPVDEVIAPAVATRQTIFAASQDTAGHITGQQDLMRTVFIGTFLILLLAVGVLTIIFSRFLTRPLEELRTASEAVGKGDLDYRVRIATGDEFEELGTAFNKMAADLKEHISTLRRTTAEKERFEKELDIAKGIQQSFLPESAPELPGIDLAGFNLPALEVGGDFYDFIPVGDNNWGLVIADVSGKGVPAALFMALSRTLIRATTTRNEDPALSIQEANNLIFHDARTSMFVTLFYAVLNVRDRTLSYVNAGHNPPVLSAGDGGRITLLEAKGIALGVLDSIALESARIQLRSGDIVVLYTDGVTEAANGRKEEYGLERLEERINASRHLTAKEIIAAIVQDVSSFAGTEPQYDDITLMVLKVA
jgi:sigma-B regulation protein RsbU (phosphoserine phosphatase)